MQNQLLFDETKIAANIARQEKCLNEHFLFNHLQPELIERLELIKRNFAHPLDFGSIHNIQLSNFSSQIDKISPLEIHTFKPKPQSYDCILSLFALEWLNDLPATLKALQTSLKPDGLFIGAFIGGSSLHELRKSIALVETNLWGGLSPRVHPMIELKDFGHLLQRAGFTLPVVDSELVTVRYTSVKKLMHDLRHMGFSNALSQRQKKPLTKQWLIDLEHKYFETFAHADGKIPATFEIIWFVGWAPHESQQKPLKPGSAQINLKDILEQ